MEVKPQTLGMLKKEIPEEVARYPVGMMKEEALEPAALVGIQMQEDFLIASNDQLPQLFLFAVMMDEGLLHSAIAVAAINAMCSFWWDSYLRHTLDNNVAL